MLSISPDILKQFDTDLKKKAVPFSIRADYRKGAPPGDVLTEENGK